MPLICFQVLYLSVRGDMVPVCRMIVAQSPGVYTRISSEGIYKNVPPEYPFSCKDEYRAWK